ncbi:hypothetical protein MUP59_04240 [Candidatus Bathyarchaeota archaeon]|nr:hypothetical protein [Candidatus Bathyarchaeota archaeon]
MTLIVVSSIKKLVKVGGLRSSTEFIEALNKKVAELIIGAAQKCKSEEGSRRTLKPQDLESA